MSFPEQLPHAQQQPAVPAPTPPVATTSRRTVVLIVSVIAVGLLSVPAYGLFRGMSETFRNNKAIAACHDELTSKYHVSGNYLGGDEVESVSDSRVKVTGVIRTGAGLRDFMCEVDNTGDGWRVAAAQYLN